MVVKEIGKLILIYVVVCTILISFVLVNILFSSMCVLYLYATVIKVLVQIL